MNASVFVAVIGALIPVTNPIFVVATYATITDSFTRQEVRRQANLVGVYSFAILTTFTVLGTLTLHAFGISLYALQIAGGLVVAQAGFGMMGPRTPLVIASIDSAPGEPSTSHDVAVSPMALPIVAGPGAIGVVLALAARHPSTADHISIVAAVALITSGLALMLRYATPLIARMGTTVVSALVRIMGFLILAVGIELLTHGVLDAVR